MAIIMIIIEQIELQAKLLNYFLGSNKSNINQSDSKNLFLTQPHVIFRTDRRDEQPDPAHSCDSPPLGIEYPRSFKLPPVPKHAK